MIASATCKYLRLSPYKLRPYADVIRGKSVDFALAWLKANANRRTEPLFKVVSSAAANAKDKNADMDVYGSLKVSEIRIDQGPIVTYFKPGAMGRANTQRKRLCHVKVVLDKKA